MRQVKKIYWALVSGKIPQEGDLIDYIIRKDIRSHVVRGRKGQYAELHFRRLGYCNGISWVEIDLSTGRHHQIRVQFANFGHPIVGDQKYGSTIRFLGRKLALHAHSLTINHPTRNERMIFKVDPESSWPKHFR
jgi:23S rRNA pseudouridine1911/1915/1917 synthase